MTLEWYSKPWLIIGIAGIMIGGSVVWLVVFIEPSIHVEFTLSSLHLTPNQLVEADVTFTNLAWVTSARNVQVNVTLPNGLTNSLTSTNQCSFTYAVLLGSQRISESFNISLIDTLPYGLYNITLEVYGDNVLQTVTHHSITVLPQLPDIIHFPSSDFNHPTPVEHPLGRNYSSWRVEIVNQLAYNASKIHEATLRFTNSSRTAYLYVVMYMDGTLRIALNDQVLYDASHSWHPDYAITLTATSTSLSVDNGTQNILVDIPIGNWTLTQISPYGGGDEGNVARTGSISCIVDTLPSIRHIAHAR